MPTRRKQPRGAVLVVAIVIAAAIVLAVIVSSRLTRERPQSARITGDPQTNFLYGSIGSERHGLPFWVAVVLPRVFALVVLMPLLYVYACAVAILGGMAVAIPVLDVSATAYVAQTQQAIAGAHFSIGALKALVFGALVALIGCHHGLRAPRSAAGVGAARRLHDRRVPGAWSIVVAGAGRCRSSHGGHPAPGAAPLTVQGAISRCCAARWRWR